MASGIPQAEQGSGIVRGLGRVSESYTYRVGVNRPECPANTYRVLDYPARLIVAGKGEIELAVDGRTQCFTIDEVLLPNQSFRITGGSGVYTGASGNGTLHHEARFTPSGAAGKDTWTGTLVVTGLNFDLDAPVLRGAVGKAVRAPRGARRVPVRYKVTARDAVDGVVPVACRPRSGSRFKTGRTIVRCSATDRSANTRAAQFRVTVKPGR